MESVKNSYANMLLPYNFWLLLDFQVILRKLVINKLECEW